MSKKKQSPVQEMPTEWRQILLEERPDGTLEPKAIHPVVMEAPPPPPPKPKGGMKPTLRKAEEPVDEWQDILQNASSGQARSASPPHPSGLSLHPEAMEANDRTIKGHRVSDPGRSNADHGSTLKTTPIRLPPSSPPESPADIPPAGAESYDLYAYNEHAYPSEASYHRSPPSPSQPSPSLGSQTELPATPNKPRQAFVIPPASTSEAAYASPFPLQAASSPSHPTAPDPEATHDLLPNDAALDGGTSLETHESGTDAFAANASPHPYAAFQEPTTDLSSYLEKPYLPPPDATRIGPLPPPPPSFAVPSAPSIPSFPPETSSPPALPSGSYDRSPVTKMSPPPAAPPSLSGSFSTKDLPPPAVDHVQVYDLLVQQQKQMQRSLEHVAEALKLQHDAFLIQTHALQTFQGQMTTVASTLETSQDAATYRSFFPLLQDLLMLFDYVDLRFRSLWEHGDRHPAVQEVAAIRKRLLDTLAQHHVEPIELTSYQFDPNLHRALQEVPASHPDEEYQISRIFRQGFLYKKALFRPVEVEIKRYSPS